MGILDIVGKVLLNTVASIGDTEQTIEALKGSPKHEWTRIFDEAMARAEERGNMDRWCQSFSERLFKEKEDHPELNGAHTVMMAVLAQRTLKDMRS